ncbi:hypothetical protein CE91St42_14220 [Oscillospiraceae bacterium]|nr:hypothetical protein CE91St42_14220 [Oscillospiraceae bacterium]
MLKIENTEVLGWEHAIRGMRNPMNSWAKSDSEVSICECERWPHDVKKSFTCLGSNDLDVMKRLRNAGTDHRKFMRMITVYVDLIGPLYWWKEFDTYKVGTVANSCSTMHKIAAKEFTLEDFSHEHLNQTAKLTLQIVIKELNTYRDGYIHGVEETDALTGEHISIDPHDKNVWWQMIQLLPSSYNQRRTVMLNYEVLANIYKSRRNHKLDEWHTFCDWIEGLPYSELITGPSLKDIPISDEILEEAKRRVHEELNVQLDYFCKSHEGFSIKIPKEKVAPEVLNLIDRVEREEQQRVKFGNHIPLAYYCQRCDAKKNGEATDAYCQKCPYKVQNDKVKIVEISVMSDGSLEPRFVMETEDNFNGKQ